MASKKKQEDADQRFVRVQKDPRFWEMPEREHKIKIDQRFQSMFHDQRFKVTYTVDKRGRPISHSSTDDLKRFYKVSDSEEEEGLKAAEEKKKKKMRQAAQPERVHGDGDEEHEEQLSAEEDDDAEGSEEDDDAEGSEEDDDAEGSEEDDDAEGSEEDDDAEEESREADGSEDEESSLDSDSEPDLARGRGNVETSSDEDDEDEVDAVLRKEEEEMEHDWGELCKDAQRSEEVSARLAVCNMDWDRMKAKDLLVLFSSFVPKGGAVLSVKIYPSEFGKERLKVEETRGPLELKVLPDDSEDDTEEERVHREKLRDYQFKRLKYFYAVVECDSADTAAKIYGECDGFEYESSCSVLDLRFIPDDVMFDHEPKDVAKDVNLSSYTPKLFTSSAASTSKVQLTWDETDHERITDLNRKFNRNDLLDMDFKAYLASSSEEEEVCTEDETVEEGEDKSSHLEKEKKSEEQINKYRGLLKSIQSKEKTVQEDRDMEMEVTWVPGLKETTEQLVKKKLEGTDKLTPWGEYLQKKKEKKNKKKSERKLKAADEELSDDELPPDVDLSDPFFTEELGASDQTDLKKKQKKKKKKQEEEERTAEEEEELEKHKAEMVLLMEDDDAAEAKHKHFNYEKIVEQQNLSKRKRKKLLKKSEGLLEDDDFQVDLKDPRFQAVYTSHLFNLDPSHPSFKRTRATQSILEEKLRRRTEEATPTQVTKQETAGKRRDSETEKKAMDPSLSLLVKSIKNKTQQFQAQKKQKLS